MNENNKRTSLIHKSDICYGAICKFERIRALIPTRLCVTLKRSSGVYVTCPPLYLWNCVISSPWHRSLPLLCYRTVGVSQQNRCSTFELDSESDKSDYRGGKLDSDAKRLQLRRGSIACVAGARSRSAAVGEGGEEEEQRLAPPPVVAASVDRAWFLTRSSATEQDDTSAGNMASYLQVRPATPLVSYNLSALSGCGCLWETWFETTVYCPLRIHACTRINRWLRGSLLLGPRFAWLNVWRTFAVSSNPPLAVADTRWWEGPRPRSFLHPETLWEGPGEGDHPPRTHHGPVNKHRHHHITALHTHGGIWMWFSGVRKYWLKCWAACKWCSNVRF